MNWFSELKPDKEIIKLTIQISELKWLHSTFKHNHMIKRLKNKNLKVAVQMQKVFLSSYAVEAKILGVKHFPPLQRTIDQYTSTDTVFYGCLKNEQLLGVIEIRQTEESLHIQSLVVDPDHFRKGIGARLIEYIFSNHYSDKYTVETGKANIPAIRLYQKQGFELRDEFPTDHGVIKVRLYKG